MKLFKVSSSPVNSYTLDNELFVYKFTEYLRIHGKNE